MIEKEILLKIKEEVFELLNNDSTGHDYFHIQRVVNNTRKIAFSEDCDVSYALLLAYLHDVGDYKLHEGIDKTHEIIPILLEPFNFEEAYINQIIRDIDLIGFKGGFNKSPLSIEVQIVQDADRLDAMGAIGIARAFAYGGSKGHLMYDPSYVTASYTSIDDYKKSKAPTIQHFYDKLLKLKDTMNTSMGRKLAIERHVYMENFLEEFYKEWVMS